VTTPRILELPILPLKSTVLFPYVLLPLSVNRPASVAAVNAAASSEDKLLAVFAQKDAQVDEPGPDDLYAVGTKALIKGLSRGEITLTGLVLPVGGIKEKVLAARRAGIRRVILPAANVKDLHDLPEPVRQELEIVGVERIEDVLAAAIPGLQELSAAARAVPRRSG
jgi:ATP-dependent Lon protease